MPINFLNLVLVNIKPVEFHLIRLYSFCNFHMSNDVKFFETPCILFFTVKHALIQRDCGAMSPAGIRVVHMLALVLTKSAANISTF